jgi:hypothetical protein
MVVSWEDYDKWAVTEKSVETRSVNQCNATVVLCGVSNCTGVGQWNALREILNLTSLEMASKKNLRKASWLTATLQDTKLDSSGWQLYCDLEGMGFEKLALHDFNSVVSRDIIVVWIDSNSNAALD